MRALQSVVILLFGFSPAAWADDTDGDLVDDAVDNCPYDSNNNQVDSDCDGIGDACDEPYSDEVCLFPPADNDSDDDGWDDDQDNCADASNTDQADIDCDFVGDVCDPDGDDGPCGGDGDGDLVEDAFDNCPVDPNPDQEDIDCDASGDACDSDPHDGPCGDHDWDEDGVPEESDVCPDDDATDHDLYADGCVDTICDFSPYIRTLEISRRSTETALTSVADSAVDSAERGRTLIAHLKLRALGNLANALNRASLLTDEQNGAIHRFSDDVGEDLGFSDDIGCDI